MSTSIERSFDLNALVRPNIRKLVPYSSARKEFEGTARVFLDANENSFGSPTEKPFNRYPDPLQTRVKTRISELRGIPVDHIFLGNGSDEAIDLLFRIFCEPGKDGVIICPPTYGMYEVSAAINDAGLVRVPLKNDFSLDTDRIVESFSDKTKLLFICSPNNPTGNAFPREQVLGLAKAFPGIVVVDEAYVQFSSQASLVSEIERYPNLVVLQTFSKAWGLAGLRVGLAFSQAPVIAYMNNVKPPYNVSTIAQDAVLEALRNAQAVDVFIADTLRERERLSDELKHIDVFEQVFPTDANFILAKTYDADALYRFLLDDAIVVRNRDSVELCGGCLRITVGTPSENDALLASIRRYSTK